MEKRQHVNKRLARTFLSTQQHKTWETHGTRTSFAHTHTNPPLQQVACTAELLANLTRYSRHQNLYPPPRLLRLQRKATWWRGGNGSRHCFPNTTRERTQYTRWILHTKEYLNKETTLPTTTATQVTVGRKSGLLLYLPLNNIIACTKGHKTTQTTHIQGRGRDSLNTFYATAVGAPTSFQGEMKSI